MIKPETIKVGQIWVVTSEHFYATIRNPGEEFKKKKRSPVLQLMYGEKIEIRFPFEWNYRTEDGIYLSSKPDYILLYCKLFGTVDRKIRSQNKATLEEILRLKLYEKNED